MFYKRSFDVFRQKPENFKDLPEIIFDVTAIHEETYFDQTSWSSTGRKFPLSETDSQCIYKRMSFEEDDEIDQNKNQSLSKHLRKNEGRVSHAESYFTM